jgi:hypothetical protein
MNKLFFGFGNAKLSETIATFSLPAGWTCPCAKDCLSKADRNTGKISDGKNAEFRCYAASAECAYTAVRKSRWGNFETLKAVKTIDGMTDILAKNIPENISKVRIHASGDFFSENYFKAWLNVAKLFPTIIFYGYTKRVGFMVKYKDQMPANFRLVASWGGTEDHLIEKHGIKSARVVFSEAEAEKLGLELDHHDDHAYSADNISFGLIIHGTQPANTPAAAAWKLVKAAGKGYNEARRKAAERAAGKS